jgi:hypothetical protein
MIRPWWTLRRLYKWLCLKLPFIVVVEYCDRCGIQIDQIWQAPAWMWEDVTGQLDGGGIRCVRCFTVEARRKGIHLQWVARLCPGFYENEGASIKEKP